MSIILDHAATALSIAIAVIFWNVMIDRESDISDGYDYMTNEQFRKIGRNAVLLIVATVIIVVAVWS